MKLLVGLGNPGEKYDATRHNIGYMVLDKLALELATTPLQWEHVEKFQADIGKIADLLLVKPTTFMNLSGEAVLQLINFYKISPTDIVVIHDDLDLPLGKIRIRDHGASGGHNGVQSIISCLGTDGFIRVRLGIGTGNESGGEKHSHEHEDHNATSQFVLSAFSDHENGEVRKLIKHATDAVRMILEKGIDVAMNQYN